MWRDKAPIGQRPLTIGHHRCQWLQVATFVQPTSGEAVWYLCSGLSMSLFAELLATFACETDARRNCSIVLVLDNASWHGPEDLLLTDGISLVFLTSCLPERQPAEHLWPLRDEPIVNWHLVLLDELSTIAVERYRQLLDEYASHR